MGTGYTRNDTADNIADGNIINASDLDGEFDALQSAFDNSTGHTHDGTAGEGAPIEKVGPNQEVVVTSTVLRPAANNTIDLGVETTNEFKNLYIDGTAYLDSVDIDGGTIDGLSVLTVDNLSLNGNTITSTDTNGNLNLRANGTGIISVDATDVNFGDNDKATFGDGSDLSITHNGTNSIITDSGTGNLLLRGSNVSIQNAAGNETVAQFVEDSFVKLYHDNSQVFSTTSTGISVTGDVGASDDLILSSDGSKITFGADGDVVLEHIHNFGLTLKTTGTGDNAFPEFVLQSNEDTIITGEVIGRIDFDTNSTAGGVSVGAQARITVDATDTYSSTVAGSRMEFYTTESGGALNKAMVIDPDQSIRFTGGTDVKLDATNDTLDFPDNFKIMMGAGDDLQIYHDGSHSYVDENGTGQLKIRSNGTGVLLQTVSGENLATFANNAAVNLYYDNSAKLATTSTGVDITGAFTATDGSTITVDDNSVALNLVSTDTDASQGPVFRLTRDATGAASDTIGTVQFYGEDAGGNPTEYVDLQAKIDDASDGSEDGSLRIRTMLAGTTRDRITINSTETILNDGSQDLDFRVESNSNANMLFVDGGNNRVGVGTNAPAYPLVVQSPNAYLQLLGTGTNTGTSGILFGDADTSTRGQINYTHSDDELSFVVNAAERMRLTNDGKLGLGTNDPSAFLHIDMGGNTSDLTGVLIATENDSNATGPDLTFRRRSASPADNDSIGALHFYGDNSASEDTRYARIFVQTRDVSDGSEDGTIKMNVIKGGSDTSVLSVTSISSGTSAGSVGINTSSPEAALDVRGDTPFIEIRDNTSGTWDYNDVFSGLKFSTNDPDAGGAGQVHAFVKAVHTRAGTGHANPDAGLSFGTSQGVTPVAIERMRITNDGFVGINESSPQAPLHITRNDNTDLIYLECTDADASEGPQVHIYRNSASPADGDELGVIKFRGNNSSNSELNFAEIQCQATDITASTEDARVRFVLLKNGTQRNVLDVRHSEVVVNNDSEDVDFRVETNNVTHMLIVDAAQNQVKIGNNTAAGGQEGNSYLSLSSPSGTRAADIDRATTTATNHIVNFYSSVGGNNTLNAVIEASGDLENTNNRYTGFSDARLKQDIVDANSQWDDIKALQVRKYRFINHVEQMGDDASVQLGVIAQELEASGMSGLVKTKPIDENDPDGPDRKSVAYSVLYMKAVKALQEAMERIETLETKVAALEAE